jgi:putative hydrolase
MKPDQRALFAEMQALMCVVEGYSNHVMNAVGKELLPSYSGIARKFEKRQRDRGIAEQLFARLTGLDIKLEQYRLGEHFVDTVAKKHGHDVAKRIWDGPAYLPTMAEIKEPERWAARVMLVSTPAPGGSVVLDEPGSDAAHADRSG